MLTRTFWILAAATSGALVMLHFTGRPMAKKAQPQVIAFYRCKRPIYVVYTDGPRLRSASWSRVQFDRRQRRILAGTTHWRRVNLFCGGLAHR